MLMYISNGSSCIIHELLNTESVADSGLFYQIENSVNEFVVCNITIQEFS